MESCFYAGYGGVTSGYIESVVDSCHGPTVCAFMAGAGANGNGGTVGNIINSCHGVFSCGYMASSTSGNIGETAGNIGDITCSCQGDGSCQNLYSANGRDGNVALSIDELSFCCNGENVCNDSSGTFTLPASCAAGDYSDSAASSCSVPQSTPSETEILPAPTFNITLSESPGCEFVADTDTIGTVTCTFEANGDSGHTVESVLLGPECSAENNNGGLTRDENPTIPPNGESSTYAVSVSIDNSALQESDDSIAFCIEASVKAGNSEYIFAQLGQKIQLDLDTDGSFSFNTTSAVADSISAGVDALNTTLTVNAFQCDASGTSTSDDLSLGDTLYICIDGEQDIVVVDAITTLNAKKSGLSDLSIIDGSNPTNNATTTVYGLDSNKAIVTTKLPLAYFESSEAVTISGDAEISAGGSGRQLSISMGKEVMSRPVVVDQGADSATAKFDLKVGVIPVSDPLEDEGVGEDVKLKTMPNSAARVPQAFKISAAAALIVFWW